MAIRCDSFRPSTHPRAPFVLARLAIAGLLTVGSLAPPAPAQTTGYYRFPALRAETIVFVSEGDLWKVPVQGGTATRLTSHPGDESQPALSPDGKTVAFTARYEGPTELYTMPVSGGLPVRRTYDAARVGVAGWSPAGEVLFTTDIASTLPNTQMFALNTSSGVKTAIPLWQASDGCYDSTAKTLFFTRLAFQGSHTKRYKGGTAQNLWKFAPGDAEATPLTPDFAGTSKGPMFWADRVYFLTDRDGHMNVWSMDQSGKDLKPHTSSADRDVMEAALDNGRIVYRVGADLRLLNIATGDDQLLTIKLESDLDQTRENWIEKPAEAITSAHISPDGDRAVITARGRVFVAPGKPGGGRLVEITHDQGVRMREARFAPDGQSLILLSDKSGEVEIVRHPANGVGEPKPLTTDGTVLRRDTLTSPDGLFIANYDKRQRLFVLDTATGANKQIDFNEADDYSEVGWAAWSPDSKWLAFTTTAPNMFQIVRLYSVETGAVTSVTTDRFDSFSPTWTPDGKWLAIVSDRNLVTSVPGPWGSHQPEPYLSKKSKLFLVALTDGLRSPFAPRDELNPPPKDKKPDEPKKDDTKKDDSKQDESKKDESKTDADAKKEKPKPPPVKIDLAGLTQRLVEVPVGPGTYSGLTVNDKALFFISTPKPDGKPSLCAVKLENENIEIKTVAAEVSEYEMSADGKKLLIKKGDNWLIIDAAPAPAELDKKGINLSGWTMSVIPRDEWRQMFLEAWRLERDYFYDPAMHGVDWKAAYSKYLPLIDRVTTRAELSDVIAQMVAELSALHIFVRGGDLREGSDQVQPSSLGALLDRSDERGGYTVSHIYKHDPDEPDRCAPLARPDTMVKVGETILAINGIATLSKPDIGLLLRAKAGQQVLLRVKSPEGAERDVIVTPMTMAAANDLRYHEWEYTRRLKTDELSKGDVGYLHLRAMGQGDWTDFAKGFYPVFNKKGLIIDVRHNRGGNIDSWVIEKLLRKAWFFWSPAVGNPPSWNMQYAFRGHVVVLCNERTASDGEAFAEGVKRLNLGRVIGTRTWGGEIWLSSSNFLVDRGIATAAETGVFGPEGEWLIEGHGVDPDVIVDNLPHATFKGEDAQLTAAIEYLQQQIKDKPVPDVKVPGKPDKSFRPVK